MESCRVCAEPLPRNARFCPACGTALAGAGPLPLEVRKTVTVLFCDLTGSTSIGERRDPEAMRRVISRYFDEMRLAVERHGGTVEKFIGDAVMAVFGIPRVHEDDALRALRAAVEMRAALEALNGELERDHGLRLQARIGVNTGEVIAGDPTLGQAFATGDAVNVAERIERAAAPGEILVSAATYRLARDAIQVEELPPLEAKGKAAPVAVRRLLSVEPGAPGRLRRLDSPMVGRGRELGLLRDAFARAVGERTCHLFTILGPAGVGKSRLVAEAQREIEERADVLVGRCLPYGDGITFWPVVEIVRQAVGIADGDDPAAVRARLAALAEDEESPELVVERVAAALGLEGASASTGEIAWGVRKLLEALARRRPLVVVLDDCNWAESTLLDLVEHVADWSRDAPILLVCLARLELLDLRPSWGGGKLNATSIVLEPLSGVECERLVRNLLGRGVERALAARIGEAAEGNPLFVEETVAMLVDEGVLAPRDGRWVAVADLARVAIPDSIQLLLAARLDRLTASERRTIERAAIEGKVFHQGAVESLAEPGDDVAGCLGSLVRKELVRPERASFAGEDAFRFRHILIREAAYEAMPKQVRADLHERFAAWLEAAAGDRVAEHEELLGHHLERAALYRTEIGAVGPGDGATAAAAAAHLGAAGLRAFARGDMPAAAGLLERAVALRAAGSPERVRLLPELGLALAGAGELARAHELLAQAVESARAAGDRGAEASALLGAASVRQYVDPEFGPDELLGVAEEAISVFEETADELGVARAWNLVAGANFVRCRFAAMEEPLDRALEHAERAGDQRERATAVGLLGRSICLGPLPAQEALRRCAELARRVAGDRVATAIVTSMEGLLHGMGRDFAEARRRLDEARAVFEDMGLRTLIAGHGSYAGLVELLADRPEAAERELRRSVELLAEMGETGRLSTVAALLARALVALGRDAEAEEVSRKSEATAAVDDLASQIVWRGARARALARRGALADAERLAREAVELAESTDSPSFRGDALLDLAEVLALAGRPEEAGVAAFSAAERYAAKGDLASLERARALASPAGLDRALAGEQGPGR